MVNDLPILDSADEHYHRAAWVTATSPDDPVNDRSTDDAEAALGAPALLERSARGLSEVRDLLVRLAVRRHGQSAVIGILTRVERTGPISAF